MAALGAILAPIERGRAGRRPVRPRLAQGCAEPARKGSAGYRQIAAEREASVSVCWRAAGAWTSMSSIQTLSIGVASTA